MIKIIIQCASTKNTRCLIVNMADDLTFRLQLENGLETFRFSVDVWLGDRLNGVTTSVDVSGYGTMCGHLSDDGRNK